MAVEEREEPGSKGIHHLERIDGDRHLPLVLVYHGPLLTNPPFGGGDRHLLSLQVWLPSALCGSNLDFLNSSLNAGGKEPPKLEIDDFIHTSHTKPEFRCCVCFCLFFFSEGY